MKLITGKKFSPPLLIKNIAFTATVCLIAGIMLSSCGVYTFRDISIDYSKIKTIRIGFFENKASYVNPQLSQKLTVAFQQKVTSLTKLTSVTTDNADYQVNGAITGYSVSTSGISSGQAATNRLTVTVHINFLNAVENKPQEFDISRDFDFPASQTLTQAESSLLSDIVKNLSDEIFNKIFSNW